ncbi:MAG TPA: Flp pilus assembly protein CpaB [Chloroflexia bacterium]|nr:Flp pilus assembly protein CpaB [Chloroflexia bacterium]
MRRGGSRRSMLLLGIMVAVLVFILLYVMLSGGNNTPAQILPPTPVPKQQVVVAQKDIKGFTVVKPDDVIVKDVDVSTVITPSTNLPDQVIGKMLTRDYQAGKQIITTDVSDPGISQVLPKGLRAFVLPIHEVDNFGGQIVDGDVVDVLWTRNFEITTQIIGADGKPVLIQRTLPTTKKVLDNIKVLRVILLRAGTTGKQGNGPVNTAPQQNASDQAASAAAAAAAQQALYATAPETPFSAALILALRDQDAEVIKFARETGVVDLTLRAKDDAETERTTGITDKIMIEDYGVQIPELIVK